MKNALSSPFADLFCSLAILACGLLFLVYRNQIGDFTGYYTGKAGWVNKPTPGWLLIPFALVLIAGGLLLTLKSLGRL